MMKHILTLTDFSEVAENAVETAFVFANKYKTDLTIYHKLEPAELLLSQFKDDSELQIFPIDDPLKKTFLDKWKSMAEKFKVSTNFLVGSGKIASSIGEINELLNVDMIVMGSKGAGGKKEYIWGSNTQKVIGKVDCPVLVIKNPMKDYRLDNIVFASSFDVQEQEILTYALDLLQPPKDAIIHLLCINTPSNFSQPTILVRQALLDFEKLVDPYNAKLHFYPDLSVDAGIRNFLKEVDPDILIMSNKIDKPFRRFIRGSNTIRAVNHADFPVLTIDFK